MNKARLSIDIARDDRRRLRQAVARHDTTIQAYVWQAVETRLQAEAADDTALRGDPMLEALWNNANDAIYDQL